MSSTYYCPFCGYSPVNPVYAADGVTIRYYRCPLPDGCNSIVRNPIIIEDLANKPSETE